MKALLVRGLVAVAIAAVVPGGMAAGSPEGPPGGGLPMMEVSGGTVTFDVATNVPAIGVRGESKVLQGRVRVREASGGVRLEQLEATVPVESLKTGISQRDKHMRQYVFTTASGGVPDLRFYAETSACSPVGAGGGTTCAVAGTLSIRGEARPFTIVLKVTERDGAFRATGDGLVKLSAYGIERPSQLLVKTADDVKLHLEFTARRAGGVWVTSGGGER